MSDTIRLFGKVLAGSNIKQLANTFPMLKNHGTVTSKKQISRGDIIEVEEIKTEVSLPTTTVNISVDNKDDKFEQELLQSFIITDLNKGLNSYLANAKNLSTVKWFAPSEDYKRKYYWHEFLVRIGVRSRKNLLDLETLIDDIDVESEFETKHTPKMLLMSTRMYTMLKSSNNFKSVKLNRVGNFNDVFLAGHYDAISDYEVYVNPMSNSQDIFVMKNFTLYYNDNITLTETDTGMEIDLNYKFDFDSLEKVSITNY